VKISNPEEHVNWHTVVDNCCIREYNVCQGEIFELTFSDLLCNDFFSPASGQEITNVYLLNNQDDVDAINIDFINETISIEVSQTLSNNRIRLKYDAKSDCGCNIITSSFTLNLAYCDEECEDEPCDDLICIDGFDELEITSFSNNIFEVNGFSFLYDFEPATDYCYHQNSFSLCTDGPDNTLQFGYKRGFVIPLQETAKQGCDIEIIIEGSAVSNDAELLIFGSVFPPCSEYETTVPFDCTLATNCGSYLYSPICLEDIFLIGDNVNSHCSDQISLDTYTINRNNLPSDINYLILSNNTLGESAIIHDIQLIENCSNSSFELEEVSCSEFTFNPFNQVEDVSFYWDFGDGETSNQMNPSHDFIENGNYTINLTVIDNCGNETTTSTEIFVECPIELICDEDNGDLIFNGEDQNSNELSDFISNGTFTSNSLVVDEEIIVNGQFTINDNIRFSNCTFYFEPGAELIIQNTGLFSIVNSSLQGCTQMWKGIQVKEGGRFHFQGNTIMDAEFAINLRDGANFDSQLNTYDRNYIGIYSEPSSTVKMNNGTPIKSSNFYCTSPLLPPYGGQENWGSLTYAGISVSDLDHLIVMEGHSAPPLIGTIPNKFEGIENGILASNTNIRIESNEFANMIGDEGISISPNLSGACIVVENSLYASITKNDLFSSARGIILYNNHFGNLEVTKNEIGQINSSSLFKLGISLRHSSFSNISVNNNVIHSGGISNYGIDINNNYLLQKLEVNNNKIFDKDFGLTSIKVDGVSFDSETAGFIESNYIEKKGNNLHSNYGMCFRLTNVETLSVESNQLNILGSPKRHYKSIYLANANNAHFRTNRISFQEDNGNGFVVLNSPQNVYCCNEVTKGNASFFYVGQNNGTTFVSNTSNDASKGLFLHDAQIGAQFHHGNLWLGNNITNATISSQTGNHQGIALGSAFTINPSQLNMFPVEVLPEVQSAIWFITDFNEMAGNCEDNPDCGIDPYDPFANNDNDNNQGDACEEYNNLVSMISTPILGGDYENQNRWTSEYSLWNTLNLMSNTDWQNCSILYDFYTNNQVIEEYSNLDQQIKSSINVSHADFDSYNLSHSSLSNSIENLVSLHSTYFDEYGFDFIENQHSFYLDDIQLQTNILSGMKSVSLTNSQISATLLIGDVISLPEPSNFHKELKLTMKIRAKILATGISSISASEWNTLNVIANSCFLEYGESVFQSRNLLSNSGIDQFDDFDIACNYEIRANESKFKSSSSEIKIFPNPSAGEFIIRNLPLESSANLLVEVYNTIGELVLKQIVKKEVSNTTLDLSDYKDGLYFINLRNNRNLIYSRKVILNK